MACIVGKPGRYGMEHEARILQKQLLIGMLLIMGIGIALGVSFRFIGSWVAWALVVVELGLLWYGKRLFARLDACRKAWSSGAEGEREVADALAKLPDCYCVIHDISTNYGNLDHVVVGPKGVFAIETKRWKGSVSADGNGGLLLNGKQPSKDPVKSLTGAIMRIKERLIPLTQISDAYIQGLIAFPISYLDAKWGSTGSAHCLVPDKIESYLEHWYNPKRTLSSEEVERIARGFAALARMEEGFEE